MNKDLGEISASWLKNFLSLGKALATRTGKTGLISLLFVLTVVGAFFVYVESQSNVTVVEYHFDERWIPMDHDIIFSQSVFMSHEVKEACGIVERADNFLVGSNIVRINLLSKSERIKVSNQCQYQLWWGASKKVAELNETRANDISEYLTSVKRLIPLMNEFQERLINYEEQTSSESVVKSPTQISQTKLYKDMQLISDELKEFSFLAMDYRSSFPELPQVIKSKNYLGFGAIFLSIVMLIIGGRLGLR